MYACLNSFSDLVCDCDFLATFTCICDNVCICDMYHSHSLTLKMDSMSSFSYKQTRLFNKNEMKLRVGDSMETPLSR